MELLIWNIVLSFASAALLLWVKSTHEEMKRLNILLNKTREEIARENVTQAEVDRIVTHIDQRFDKLNDKLDAFIRESRSALN